MQMSLSFSEGEKEFFKVYLELLKKYHKEPQKLNIFVELKALDFGIENLQEVLEKFNEFLRRYLFFKSKRQELEEILPVSSDIVPILEEYPYFVAYEAVKTYPSKGEYKGFKLRGDFLLAGAKDGKIRIWKVINNSLRFLKELGNESEGFPKYELQDNYLFYSVGNELKVYYLPSGKVVASVDIGQPAEALNLENGKVYLYKKISNIAIKQQVSVADGIIVFGPADPILPTQIESGEIDMTAIGQKLIKAKDGKIFLFEGAKRVEGVSFVLINKFDFGYPINDLLIYNDTIIIAPSGTVPAVSDFKGNIVAELSIPLSHSYRIRRHPKRELIAISHNQNLISIWNMENFQPVKILESYFIDVLGLDFSPDGKYLVASGEGRDINIWDTESWEMVKDLDLPTEGIMAVKFSPDGNILAAGTSEGTIYLIDTQSWEVVKELHSHTDMVSDILFVGNNELVSASWDGRALLWNLETGEVEKVLQDTDARVWKLALSEDGKYIAIADWEGLVLSYSTEKWKEEAKFADKSGVSAVAFGENHLVIGRKDGTLELIELQAKEEKGQKIVEISAQPSEKAVGVSPFKGNLLAYTEKNKIAVWDSEGEKVFTAKVEGKLSEVENLKEPQLTVEVLPETYLIETDGYFYGAKGWENYIQILKGLEIVENKEEFLKEITKPELLEKL